ncbi:S9 family peptidase [Tenggerimyces flavus]|uniref:Prolyl oligopeptidase family serine peptidase n=1 Tax=Tenggerimyces flavus TaxID=1708749 RepID=A0ABV7Y3R6_9ACTN|nr:prolyl oligopeptidase family serine peptidase [Tenggerimyces flavus]MBM7788541.1 dipeptidyl-peptidase-4 [Tenggerimyces flavus]
MVTTEQLIEQIAKTRGLTLGHPKSFTISPDGARVVFLRSDSGTDSRASLRSYDVATGTERLVFTASADADADLPPEERARRERARQSGGGVVNYATDADVRLAAFALGGTLWTADLVDGNGGNPLPAAEGVVDPRPDPTGRHVAYVSHGALRVIGANGDGDRALLEPDGEEVTYGLAEHVAGESMDRYRGFWWSPDGQRLLVARVDTAPVQRWYIADPANPAKPPQVMAYPAAGTPNADVSLHLVDLTGARVEVGWDRAAFEYVVAVTWTGTGLLVLVQSRDQRTVQVLAVDPATGQTDLVHEDHDDAWWELVGGAPARTSSGALVWTRDADDTRRLVIDGELVTPIGLHVREICSVDGETVLFAASPEQPQTHLYTYSAADGVQQVSEGVGVFTGQRAGGTTVVVERTMDGVRTLVVRDGSPAAELVSHGAKPVLTPRAELLSVGERGLPAMVFWPSWYERGSGKLPVLLSPYAGTGAQLVVAALSRHHLTSQWFAEHGFVVVTIDGRGTPGRSPSWEKSIYGDKISHAVTDQVDGLHAVAALYPDLDLDRVGVRGWSYGGTLAAAMVLRRPDVIHAAVAGAPVTDARLYDTHWQERYLGHPEQNPEAYDRSSVMPDAARLSRPLMLVHGLADDNVVAAHTLRLSSALLAAGKPHEVLPLSGVTHMAGGAQHMLLQVEFLRRSLGLTEEQRPGDR